MVGPLEDPRRVRPEFGLAERPMLEGWLDFHRVTLELKCEGLTAEQLARCAVPSSKLSLQGLIRHMADVERHWFRRVLIPDPELPPRFFVPGTPDSELTGLDSADFASDLEAFREECAASRAAAAERGLDDAGATRDGTPVSVRWIYVHMIEEYARHNGHADFLRELADGSVGM